MTTPAAGEAERNGLAYVCGHLDEIRASLQPDDSPLLRLLLDEVRDGREIADLLDALHLALQRGGDALGVYGHGVRGLSPAGIEDRPLEVVYLCPVGRCSGRRWADVAASSLRCTISGRDLIRERL